jgi:hypothetical protein
MKISKMELHRTRCPTGNSPGVRRENSGRQAEDGDGPTEWVIEVRLDQAGSLRTDTEKLRRSGGSPT